MEAELTGAAGDPAGAAAVAVAICVLTQTPPQSIVGGEQAQEPSMQLKLAPQTLPQAPQWMGLSVMSTQKPPQRRSEPGHSQRPADSPR